MTNDYCYFSAKILYSFQLDFQYFCNILIPSAWLKKIFGNRDERPFSIVTCVNSYFSENIQFIILIIFKGHLDKYIIPLLFLSKKVGIFMSLEVLAWVTVCWVLHSRLTLNWLIDQYWNINISSTFYFSKSTSITTLYSILWETYWRWFPEVQFVAHLLIFKIIAW